MSAFGGKADVVIAAAECPLVTQSGHWPPRRVELFIAVSGVGISGVRIKQLLAINLEVGDGLLSVWRHQPVDETLVQTPCSHSHVWPGSPV